jgi:hypothetical protein
VLHLTSSSLLSLLRPARIAILARLCAQLSYTALLIAILSVNLRSIVLQQHPYDAGRTANCNNKSLNSATANNSVSNSTQELQTVS